MNNFERIIKECFWDLNIKEQDIEDFKIGKGPLTAELLFEKILANSSMLLLDLKIFPNEELSRLLNNYKIQGFNSEYLGRRKNMAEVFFLNKPLEIDELKWPA